MQHVYTYTYWFVIISKLTSKANHSQQKCIISVRNTDARLFCFLRLA